MFKKKKKRIYKRVRLGSDIQNVHKHSLPLLLTSFNFARVFLLFALEDA